MRLTTQRRFLGVALALALGVSTTACTSDDENESTSGPSTSTTSPTPTAAPTPTPSTPGADQSAIDDRVRAAIESKDTTALRDALRAAGTADGTAAVGDPDGVLDADSRRNYRIAGWWLPEYEDDAQFSELFDDGDVVPFEDLSQQSSLLTELSTLADHVQDDWQDQTGKRLSFNDTYDVAFDAARG